MKNIPSVIKIAAAVMRCKWCHLKQSVKLWVNITTSTAPFTALYSRASFSYIRKTEICIWWLAEVHHSVSPTLLPLKLATDKLNCSFTVKMAQLRKINVTFSWFTGGQRREWGVSALEWSWYDLIANSASQRNNVAIANLEKRHNLQQLLDSVSNHCLINLVTFRLYNTFQSVTTCNCTFF